MHAVMVNDAVFPTGLHSLAPNHHFFIDRKAVIGAALIFAVFLAVVWVFPTVAMITLPPITLVVPEIA